jgi:hypothetical protein
MVVLHHMQFCVFIVSVNGQSAAEIYISLVLLFRDVLQVAFLASEVGPRVAAACASAALSVLTRDDSR